MPHNSLSQYQQWYNAPFNPAAGMTGVGSLPVPTAMNAQQVATQQMLGLTPEQMALIQAEEVALPQTQQQIHQQIPGQQVGQPAQQLPMPNMPGMASNGMLSPWVSGVMSANPTPLNPAGQQPQEIQQAQQPQNLAQDMLTSLKQIQNMFYALLMFTGGMLDNPAIKPLSESVNTKPESPQPPRKETSNQTPGNEEFAPAATQAGNVAVTFIEAEAPDGTTTHMKDVAGVFNYITGSKFANQKTVILKPDQGNWSTPEEYVNRSATHALNSVSNTLSSMTAGSDGFVPQVVNGSLQYSKVEIYKGLKEEVAANPAMAAVIGGSDDAAIVKYVDTVLASSVPFQDALANYQAVTKAAADKKIAVVVAAGNSNAADPQFGFAGAAEGDGLNFLAMSEDVISVAATQLNDTKDNYVDDEMAGFSSRGDGRFNPTITAPGGGLGTDQPLPGTSGVLNGTSFSAPIVEGTLAEAFAKNPNITVAELRAAMIQTAVDRPDDITGFDAKDEGAGLINREALLKSIAS